MQSAHDFKRFLTAQYVDKLNDIIHKKKTTLPVNVQEFYCVSVLLKLMSKAGIERNIL